jgi:hypothetical protein
MRTGRSRYNSLFGILTGMLLVAPFGLPGAAADAMQSGDLPPSSTLDAAFNCPKGSLQIAVHHHGESVALSRLQMNGKPAAATTHAAVRSAMQGFTRITGISARCGRASITVLVQGHAGTEAARRSNGSDEDDIGKRLIFEGGVLKSADVFSLQ